MGMLARRRILRRLLANFARVLTFLRRRQLHSRPARFRKRDGNRLLRGSSSRLPLSNAIDLVMHEFARLGRRGLALAFILAGLLDSFLLWHKLSTPLFGIRQMDMLALTLGLMLMQT